MTKRDELLDEVRRLIDAGGKHSSYQALPPCVGASDGDRSPASTPRLDESRWDYFRARIPISLKGETAVDIGANIGYFTFRLACELEAAVLAYEPCGEHSRAMTLIREACGLPAERVSIRPAGVGLADVPSLPRSKLTLLLNVLQHAGQDFDGSLVPDAEAWRAYAVRYLTALRARTEILCFQLGYTWLGHREKLCPDDAIIDFTHRLVREAGWSVVACGVIRRLAPDLRYDNYPLAEDRPNPLPLGPWPVTPSSRLRGLLFAGRERRRRNLHRFAQRPVWVLSA